MIQGSKVKFVFFGSDDFSIAVLDELGRAGFLPSLIVTVPDRPKGRGLRLNSPPIKLWAIKHNVPFFQTEKFDSDFIRKLSNASYDIFIVASYGKIIPKNILDIPAKGVLNVHPSLLPKFRGSSPVQSAILADDKKTGVTIMLMDEKMDHGPIVVQKEVSISPWPPSSAALEKLLAVEGAKILAETVPFWLEAKILARKQDDSLATYCGKFKKTDALINLSENPYKNYLKIKAFDRSPVAYIMLNRKGRDIRILIKDAEYKNGVLVLKRVLPEGKREMSYEDFLKGGR